MPDEMSIGDQLLQLCAEATSVLVLVAPFMKFRVMERVLQATKRDVEVSCFTRWRPDEIVAGVSDIEIWRLVSGREGTTLRLAPHLHAKYYRADDRCMVGSANLTDRALGWSREPNLELAVSMPASIFADFERRLQFASAAADETVYQATLQAVEGFAPPLSLPTTGTTVAPQEDDECIHPDLVGDFGSWLPSLRHPEDLHAAYLGRSESLSQAARLSAERDLEALDIPQGLSEEAFQTYVGVLLLQHPVIRMVDELAVRPQRFGAIRDLLRSTARSEAVRDNPTRAWQSLMRWLVHFLPLRYAVETPRHSEMLARR